MHVAQKGLRVSDDTAEEQEVFAAAARALSTRSQLETLLLEALLEPGLALGPVEKISALFQSGQLRDAEAALDVLRGRDR